MKRQGWEMNLVAFVEAARDRDFIRSHHDCATWVFSWVELARDETIIDWRGEYADATGAKAAMTARGWTNPARMARSILGPALKTVRLAQRGDVILGRDGAFGICLGAQSVTVSVDGLVMRPTSGMGWCV